MSKQGKPDRSADLNEPKAALTILTLVIVATGAFLDLATAGIGLDTAWMDNYATKLEVADIRASAPTPGTGPRLISWGGELVYLVPARAMPPAHPTATPATLDKELAPEGAWHMRELTPCPQAIGSEARDPARLERARVECLTEALTRSKVVAQ